MTKREIIAAINKNNKLFRKWNKLRDEAKNIETIARSQLEALAKSTCPYKKGQIFKNTNALVWAKGTGVSAPRIIKEGSTYTIDCLRCNKAGIVQKDKWIFIPQNQIGVSWDPIKQKEGKQ